MQGLISSKSQYASYPAPKAFPRVSGRRRSGEAAATLHAIGSLGAGGFAWKRGGPRQESIASVNRHSWMKRSSFSLHLCSNGFADDIRQEKRINSSTHSTISTLCNTSKKSFCVSSPAWLDETLTSSLLRPLPDVADLQRIRL